MEIQSRIENNTALVTVTGRMDAVTAPLYQQKMDELIAAGTTNYVIDFNNLDYISSAGLRVILATAKVLKGKNGRLEFANVRGAVSEVFKISGFGSIFQMYDSVPAALAAIV